MGPLVLEGEHCLQTTQIHYAGLGVFEHTPASVYPDPGSQHHPKQAYYITSPFTPTIANCTTTDFIAFHFASSLKGSGAAICHHIIFTISLILTAGLRMNEEDDCLH